MPSTLSEDEIDDLLYFARIGDIDEFNTLKDQLCQREGVAVLQLLQSARDEGSGNGILHMAAANGHAVLLRDLCKALSNPSPQNPPMLAVLNAQNLAGNTALHWAALNGHLESVKVLLEEGSDPTIVNQRGHDAVYEAELNDKREVVEWVLKEGGEGLEEGVSGDVGEGSAEENADEEMDIGEDTTGVDVEMS
ncbi:ankyrin repeat-containing domain protein [Halenospora varia]|nr:ankyrin repeat-containing domain protein [Halenospora varia]